MDKMFFQILLRSYKVLLQNLVKSYFNENMGKIFSDFINTLQRSSARFCEILFSQEYIHVRFFKIFLRTCKKPYQ